MDVKVQQPSYEDEVVDYMEPAKAGKMLFDSYEYSQGDQLMQALIFHRLHEKFPDLRINPDDITTIEARVTEKVLRYAIPNSESSPSMHIDTTRPIQSDDDAIYKPEPRKLEVSDFIKEVKDRLKNLSGIFDGTYPRVGNRDLNQFICEGIIAKDYDNKNGRPRRFGANRRDTDYDPAKSPRTDPHASHICDYVIRRYEVGVPEFNSLFDDIQGNLVSSIQNHTLNETSKQKLNEILSIYDQYHEGRNVRQKLEELTGMTSEEMFG